VNVQRILFPTDFSRANHAALEVAVSLARDCNATLVIAHCEDTPLGGEYSYGAPMPDNKPRQAELDQMMAIVKGVRCEKRLVYGNPAQAIVGLAEKESIDLIVMGTHGRTGFRRALMGSVSEAVVRHAKCPVLTIRQAGSNFDERQCSASLLSDH